MKNGLYQVTTKYFCAGFFLYNDKVIQCAPILRNSIEHWKKIAKYIGDNMEVRGVVVSVEFDVAVAKNGGGSYQGARFTYRDDTGKIQERGFHNNVFKFNAGLKTQLSNLNPNDKFVMSMEKKQEDKYWNVKSIGLDDGQPVAYIAGASIAGAKASPKSTYETPEERAKKQIYIVRQSSFTSAMTLLGTKAKTASDVIPVAKEIEAYVFGDNFDSGLPVDMTDDIPQ